jgi:NADH dehydrogenase
MGVEVRLNSPLIKVTPDEVLLKDNSTISTKTVIWTAGVQGNLPGNQWGLATNRRNQVEILPTLQTPDHPEVYVVGDLAEIHQDGRPLPMVAQVGIQSGSAAGRNILRQMAGEPTLPFRYRDKGTLAVIGRNAAAAYIWGRSFRGFLAWVIWVGIHIFYLIGFRNRLQVLINWAWAYFFSEHGVRLILPANPSAPKAPPAKEMEIEDQVRLLLNTTKRNGQKVEHMEVTP